MADRLFAGAILLIVIGYTAIAFTGIKAPFQYDPLGPESWPQMLGLVSLATLGYIMVRPAVGRIDVNRATLFRLGIVVLFMIA